MYMLFVTVRSAPRVTLEPVPVMALTEDLSSEGVGGHMATEQLHCLRAGSSCML